MTFRILSVSGDGILKLEKLTGDYKLTNRISPLRKSSDLCVIRGNCSHSSSRREDLGIAKL